LNDQAGRLIAGSGFAVEVGMIGQTSLTCDLVIVNYSAGGFLPGRVAIDEYLYFMEAGAWLQ